MSIEDEQLKLAIQASISEAFERERLVKKKTKEEEKMEKLEKERKDQEDLEKLIRSKKPSPPSATPPESGMKLVTVVKNGWVTQEWR